MPCPQLHNVCCAQSNFQYQRTQTVYSGDKEGLKIFQKLKIKFLFFFKSNLVWSSWKMKNLMMGKKDQKWSPTLGFFRKFFYVMLAPPTLMKHIKNLQYYMLIIRFFSLLNIHLHLQKKEPNKWYSVIGGITHSHLFI